MPQVVSPFAPHRARLFSVSAGVRTALDWYDVHLVISSTQASVEEGAIRENELGKVIFATAYKDAFTVGRELLVNGEFYKIVGPVEIMNSIRILQRCECAVQRIKT